jgi:DNA-binding transcriptional ArsR family regulator
MSTHEHKRLRWIKQVQVSPCGSVKPTLGDAVMPTARERLVAALAERPQTVAQLAANFGLSQPTVLDHVRRALRDGVIIEVEVAPTERRFAAERYYAPTVPVIRVQDRELIESACRAVAHDIAASMVAHRADLEAAFAMTTLAREGWAFADLEPYLDEMIRRLASQHDTDMPPHRPPPSHGLAWVEEVADFAVELDGAPAAVVERREDLA